MDLNWETTMETVDGVKIWKTIPYLPVLEGEMASPWNKQDKCDKTWI